MAGLSPPVTLRIMPPRPHFFLLSLFTPAPPGVASSACAASIRSINFFMTDACLQGWTEASCWPEWGNASIVIVLKAWSEGTSWNTWAGVKGDLF